MDNWRIWRKGLFTAEEEILAAENAEFAEVKIWPRMTRIKTDLKTLLTGMKEIKGIVKRTEKMRDCMGCVRQVMWKN